MKYELSKEDVDEVVAALDTKINLIFRGDYGSPDTDDERWIAQLTRIREVFLDDSLPSLDEEEQ